MITKKCLICGKLFKVSLCVEKKGYGLFCSRECFHRSKEVDLKCPSCGKQFRVAFWEAKNGRKYCSYRCSIGKIPWMKGKKHTEEAKVKMSKSLFKKGSIPWNKGKTGIFSKDVILRMSAERKGRSLSEKARTKISEANKGKRPKNFDFIHSPEMIEKRILACKLSSSGEKSYMWKGDDVGYRGLHSWIRKKLGRPDTCEHCGKIGLTGHKINWANRSGKYLRDTSDWLRLCVKCHREYDATYRIKHIEFVP
jgi:endogenous inhibitor of DNA gyrase (YacG/DUF329 family)